MEVVILSRNSAETGLRTAHSIRGLGLPITRAAFTRGRPAHQLPGGLLLRPLPLGARGGRRGGAQGRLPGRAHPAGGARPRGATSTRCASPSTATRCSSGPRARTATTARAWRPSRPTKRGTPTSPWRAGPSWASSRRSTALQRRFDPEACPIRTALITARDAVSQQRVVRTLRALEVRIDECFFLGGVAKERILKAWRPHIFFDDQLAHVEPASRVSPAAQVPRHDTPEAAERGAPDARPGLSRAGRSRRACPGRTRCSGGRAALFMRPQCGAEAMDRSLRRTSSPPRRSVSWTRCAADGGGEVDDDVALEVRVRQRAVPTHGHRRRSSAGPIGCR